MAISVCEGQVLVGWGRGLPPAQKPFVSAGCSEPLLQTFLLLPSEVCACPGHPRPIPYFMLTPKCLSPSLIPSSSMAWGLVEAET